MTRLARAMPLALTVVGGAVVTGLWVYRVWTRGAGLAGVCAALAGSIYGGWMLRESRVSVAELGRPEARGDRGSLELAAVAKLALLASLLLPQSGGAPVLLLAGVLVLAGGTLLRAVAVSRLGARYSHRIRAPEPPLEEQGPYAVVRHPAYLGTAVSHLGLVGVFPSWYSVSAWLLLWLPAVVLRTALEDRYLCRTRDYASYAARVRARLVPFVW